MGMNATFPANAAKKLPLPTVDDPDSPEAHAFVARRQPFACRVRDWGALAWSVEALQAKVGHVPREMIRVADKQRVVMSTADLLALIAENPGWKAKYMPAEGGGPPINLRRPDYQVLAADVRIPAYVAAERNAVVMMRNSRANAKGEYYDTPCHYEPNAQPAVYVQLLGTKTLWLFAPEEAPHLGVESAITTAPYMSNGADACADPVKYPQIANATCYEIVLEPGTFVYWPEFWFHWFVHHHDFQMNLRIDWDAPSLALQPMSASWAYANALAEALGGFGQMTAAFRALPPETQALLVRIDEILINTPRTLSPREMTAARFRAGFPTDQTAYKPPA